MSWGLSQVSVRARISNVLDITKSVILADLLWTDLTLLVDKWIFCRTVGPGFIWMSSASGKRGNIPWFSVNTIRIMRKQLEKQSENNSRNKQLEQLHSYLKRQKFNILATWPKCKQTLILYFVNTSEKAGSRLVEVRTNKYYFRCQLETIMTVKKMNLSSEK